MKKVLITPQGFNFVRSRIKPWLQNDTQYIFTNGIVEDRGKLTELLSDVSAVVIGSEKIDKSIIESSRNLKAIVRFGTTLENIDASFARERGIKVFSIKSTYTVDGVARLCLTFLLNYIFNMHKHFEDSRNGNWTRYMNTSPENITVGLIGSGDIALGFLKLGKKLGFKYNYHSRNNNKNFETLGATYFLKIADLINSSDVVSVHIPLNESTKNLIDRDLLSLFERKLLINTSRAGVVNQNHLEWAIKKVDSFSYFTDVLDEEPPRLRDLKLITEPNILSTAHIGGYTDEALIDVALQALTIVSKEI